MAIFSKLFAKKANASLMSPEQFADRYIDFVKQSMPDIQAVRDGSAVTLTWPDGGAMNHFMKNAYASYAQDSEALARIFEAHLANALEVSSGAKVLDPALILPVIKTTDWLSATMQQRGHPATAERALIVHPLAGDLITVYAQDLAASIEYIKHGDLTETLGEVQLREQALANLLQHSSSLHLAGGDGRYRIELDGLFDSSLMLVASAWIDKIQIAGNPVFAVPCRDQLMVCGEGDPDAVAMLPEVAPQIAQDSSYPVSGRLFILRDGEIQPLPVIVARG